jgi:GNAT superfamily N-acetyltransferase
MVIVPVSEAHARKSFDCERSGLNDFLALRALSPIYGKTYVLVPDIDSSEVIAYFTLSPDPIEIKTDGSIQILTRYVKLLYLAVDYRYKNKGIGTDLLLHVMRQVARLDDNRIQALALEPLDEAAWEWFRSRDVGFEYEEFPEPGLILPVASIRDALNNQP